MGGWDGDTSLTSVEILSLATKEWRRGPALPSRVSEGHSTVYEDTLYLLDTYRGRSVYSLSQDTRQWKVAGNIGKLSADRAVFPAPIVSSKMLGC